MVAVHRLTDHRHPTGTTRRSGTARPTLRLIEGGASTRAASTSPASVLTVVAIVLTLSLVILVRGVQGAPPAGDWNSLAGATTTATPTAAVAGDTTAVTTFTVGVDDTWATIAAEVAPGADPVEVARRLAGVNGGYALRPGQVLTIPPTLTAQP